MLERSLKTLGVAFAPPLGQTPTGLGIDSRTIGPNEIFLAYRGEHFDGHDFVAQVGQRGVAGAVVRSDWDGPSHLPLARADDPNALLGRWGAAQRRIWGGKVVGVTGSSGKTTVKDLLAAGLADGSGDTVLATRGNLNNLIGVPLTLLRLGEEHRLAVVEMGMNARGEIAQLSRWAAPDVGAIVNVGAAHSGMLGGLDGVRRAKLEIASGIAPGGVLVLPEGLNGAPLRPDLKVLRFGEGEGCDVQVVARRPSGTGQHLRLRAEGQTVEVDLPLPGPHQGGNVAAALAVGLGLGLDLQRMARRFEAMTPPVGRMNRAGDFGAVTLWDDTYNANPDSVLAAWRAIEEQAALGGGEPVLVLGTLKEVDPADPAWGRLTGALVSGRGRLVVVGDEALACRFQGMGSRCQSFATQEQALVALADWWPEAGAVVLKGSRAARMERLLGGVQERMNRIEMRGKA